MKSLRTFGMLSLATLLTACSEIKSLTESETEGASQIELSTQSTSVLVNSSTTINVRVTKQNSEPVKDGTQVEMTATAGQLEPSSFRTHDGGRAAITYRASTTPGTARLQAKSGSASGELALTVQAPAPEPLPPAPSAPSSASSPSGSESVDLAQVTWLHTDVSGWAVTSQITSASIGDPPICINHTMAGRWPVKDDTEGNPWVFVNLNGRWYAATYEWLRPGQICKGITRDNIGPHIGRPPLDSWRPRSGEVVGLMVSARARAHADTVQERSNIVFVRWP